jgi:hypothetical protein
LPGVLFAPGPTCPHSCKPTRFASNPNPNPNPNPGENNNGANRVGFPGKSGPGQITTGQTGRSPSQRHVGYHSLLSLSSFRCLNTACAYTLLVPRSW